MYLGYLIGARQGEVRRLPAEKGRVTLGKGRRGEDWGTPAEKTRCVG